MRDLASAVVAAASSVPFPVLGAVEDSDLDLETDEDIGDEFEGFDVCNWCVLLRNRPCVGGYKACGHFNLANVRCDVALGVAAGVFSVPPGRGQPLNPAQFPAQVLRYVQNRRSLVEWCKRLRAAASVTFDCVSNKMFPPAGDTYQRWLDVSRILGRPCTSVLDNDMRDRSKGQLIKPQHCMPVACRRVAGRLGTWLITPATFVEHALLVWDRKEKWFTVAYYIRSTLYPQREPEIVVVAYVPREHQDNGMPYMVTRLLGVTKVPPTATQRVLRDVPGFFWEVAYAALYQAQLHRRVTEWFASTAMWQLLPTINGYL